MYLEMNPTMQLYNTFRNRWCGAYWASKGIRVIPTINWGDVSSFDFCFCGVEKGSTVAVSTYMASAHNNHADQKAWFMKGYNEMLNRIQPEKVICYNRGAFLTTQDPDTVKDLKKLEDAGVAVMTCGTCLDFYGLILQ